MATEYDVLTHSEARHYANIALNLPRDEVRILQNVLRRRAQEAGVADDTVYETINGMTDRFLEEERTMMRQLMEEQLQRNGVLAMSHIPATDDDVVTAIKRTLRYFKSDRDWAGIYRPLVDLCGYPLAVTDFVKRFARMGIYAKDKTVIIERLIPPAISEEEYQNHPFSYSAVQKGFSTGWGTINEWKRNKLTLTDRDFQDRVAVAEIFISELNKATAVKNCARSVLS